MESTKYLQLGTFFPNVKRSSYYGEFYAKKEPVILPHVSWVISKITISWTHLVSQTPLPT